MNPRAVVVAAAAAAAAFLFLALVVGIAVERFLNLAADKVHAERWMNPADTMILVADKILAERWMKFAAGMAILAADKVNLAERLMNHAADTLIENTLNLIENTLILIERWLAKHGVDLDV